MLRPLLTTPRRQLPCALAGVVLVLSGCSADPDAGTDARPDGATEHAGSTSRASATAAATVSAEPLIQGFDVCRLASPQQVRQAVGQEGEPTARTLTRIPGYRALVDQCGFGPAFRSSSLVVGVGLAPATRKDLRGLPGRPVANIGDAARSADSAEGTTVSFLKGSTLVQVHADRGLDGTSRAGQLASVARAIARAVPADPPGSDVQTSGACADIDNQAVEGLLKAPVAVSRTLLYKDRSAACSWATGLDGARTLTVSLYANAASGQFFADQKTFEKWKPVPGVSGDAFTIPGRAYVVSEDGQAVSVGGSFAPGAAADEPLPVTPELTRLMSSAATLMR